MQIGQNERRKNELVIFFKDSLTKFFYRIDKEGVQPAHRRKESGRYCDSVGTHGCNAVKKIIKNSSEILRPHYNLLKKKC